MNAEWSASSHTTGNECHYCTLYDISFIYFNYTQEFNEKNPKPFCIDDFEEAKTNKTSHSIQTKDMAPYKMRKKCSTGRFGA